MSKTKHSCSGPAFGRLAPQGECARCDELRSGAPARQAPGFARAKKDREDFIRSLKAHNCKERGCGPVCTFGDW